jgi:hypothetical protein
MKKIRFYTMMMSLSLFQSIAFASEKKIIPDTVNKNEIPAEVKRMLNRLEEIKTVDKSSMSRLEKKELRKEAREIKADLKASNSSVYLAIGGLVIIVAVMVFSLI